MEPAIPIDEGKRLASLRKLNILDTSPEERFDRITRLAQRMFGVPVALISLIDSNRQWFKSCQGLEATEMPRSVSFCGHALHGESALVIPDTLEDARFTDDPLVTDAPHIRFYAGQPIKTPDGSRIGTLCIVDYIPRQLNQEDLATLRDMGMLVEDELGTQDILDAASIIKSSEGRLQAVMDNVLDGIITINAQGSIESFNRGAEQIFGYREREVTGCNVNKLMPEPHQTQHDRYIKDYLDTGHRKIIGLDREVTGLRKNGETFQMELAVTEMKLGDSQIFTGIVRDISERKKIQKMKDEFTAVVSHELRTPLTSIRGALGLVMGSMQETLPPQVKELLDIASRNSERLLLLVNDILDIEKIEAGGVKLDMQSIELLPLVKLAVDANTAYAQQFGVTYRIELPDSTVAVMADADRLMQVMANLLSNAAKFSPEGGTVEISLRRTGNAARISVTDHGPGITHDFSTRIFQKFSQADSSGTRSRSGTGLGLSISKALVEMMSGVIGYDSKPGEGSTFFVEFPLPGEPRTLPENTR